MGSHDGTHVGMGAALTGIGGAGMLTLLIYAESGLAQQPSAWDRGWFQAVFVISALLALLGTYVLTAVYWPRLPLPATRSEREHAPDLRIESIDTEKVNKTVRGDTRVVFCVGFRNRGRGDVTNASVNVRVPGDVSDFGFSNAEGSSREIGSIAKSGDVWYWNQDGLTFSGRTAYPYYFALRLDPPRPFSVSVWLASASLRDDLEQSAVLDPSSQGEPE